MARLKKGVGYAETDPARAARARSEASEKANPFWGLVNLAREIRLPKPHLTQSEIVDSIEAGMAEMDEAGRASAFRQVLTGVISGEFSQYAVLPFGHFATSSLKDDDGKERTRNRTPEARRLMAVIDALQAEMPEDSEFVQRNAAYSEAVESVREEDGKVDESRLTALILEADKADQPFWTDSREFIRDGEVSGSSLSLVDLAMAGAVTVQETGGGGSKAFVAGGKYMAEAVDKLADAGFEKAAELLRSRTQRRQSPAKLGKGLSALVGLGGNASDEDGEES